MPAPELLAVGITNLSKCAGRRTDDRTSSAVIGNPLFLVKARMQAYTPSRPAAAQYYYPNIPSAYVFIVRSRDLALTCLAVIRLSSIVRTEGPKGLVRGMDAAILRTCMGSAVRAPVFVTHCVLTDEKSPRSGPTAGLQLCENDAEAVHAAR